MALTQQQILDHPDLHSHVQRQSAALIGMFEADARLAAVFATQQRWLMSHAGLALYFRTISGKPGSGLNLTGFLDVVTRHRLASRNTADSYIKEMVKYKYVTMLPETDDRRFKPMRPSETVIQALAGWLRVHLATLDSLTGGNRLAAFDAAPQQIARLQPMIADGLIAARAIRSPEKTFSLFTWLDNGGLVMDWLIASMDNMPMDAERVPVGKVSIVEMAARLGLSRTHLARKLREAESMGSIGWEDKRGQSVMWVSRAFRQEYAAAQAAKLAIIDAACEDILPR